MGNKYNMVALAEALGDANKMRDLDVSEELLTLITYIGKHLDKVLVVKDDCLIYTFETTIENELVDIFNIPSALASLILEIWIRKNLPECYAIKRGDYEIWTKNGLRHRDNDLPAVIDDGRKTWYQNGQKHRDNDLPAVIDTSECSSTEWFQHGKRHRDGGKPANITKLNKSYYMYGIEISEELAKKIVI